MDDFLDGLELDSDEETTPNTTRIEITPNARDKLMSTLKET